MLTLQVFLIILFAIFVDYSPDADAKTPEGQIDNEHLNDTYPSKYQRSLRPHPLVSSKLNCNKCSFSLDY